MIKSQALDVSIYYKDSGTLVTYLVPCQEWEHILLQESGTKQAAGVGCIGKTQEPT